MRLLLTTQDFPPKTGGIETYCFELAKRLVSQTEAFGVMAPSHKRAGELDSTLPYKVYRLPTKDSLLPIIGTLSMPSIAAKWQYDTAFHAQWQTVWASLLSRKIVGYPRHIYVAAHARELLIPPFNGQGGPISRQFHQGRKQMFSKVDGFFPVSFYTASLLQDDGVPEDKIHVVGNGTDPQKFKPKDSAALRDKHQTANKKVVLTICRLVRRKGIDLVLEAMKKINEDRDDILYLIGGAGPDKSRLQSMVSELGLDDSVEFLGRVPEEQMADYYNLADVFVMPASNSPPDVEGFGIVFLEANACETPVIGARTGGIPDAITHGETGFIIEDRNVLELINYLEKLLNNKDLATKIGKRGREVVLEKANWDYASQRILSKIELINQQTER